MKKQVESALMCAFALTLSNCTVGPDYQPPEDSQEIRQITAFKHFKYSPEQWKKATPKDAQERGPWWEIFHDDRLSEYMLECAKSNPDIKSLSYKVDQLAEAARIRRSALYPNAVATGDYAKLEVGDNSILRPFGSQFEDWALGATLTWDADLFGRIRSTLAASRAEAQSAEFEYESALLALRARIAALYFSIRQIKTQCDILEKDVAIRQKESSFMAERAKINFASRLDAERALAQEFNARAQLTSARESLATLKNMLAYLLGKTPATLQITAAPLEKFDLDIPAQVPSLLLERRSDIAAAERMVLAANHRIGAAQAAFFPTVSITSSLGVESSAFSKLINSSSFAWGVSPQVYLPIFQAGRLCAQKRIALAKHKEALEKYKSTVLKAIRETEDALAKSAFAKRKISEMQTAADAAARVEKISDAQYEQGVIDYFQKAQASRANLAAMLALAREQGNQYRAAVELIRAIGGFWERPGAKEIPAAQKAVEAFEKGI